MLIVISSRGFVELPRSHHSKGKGAVFERPHRPTKKVVDDSQGQYPFPLDFGKVPGSDGAGIVEAVGAHVTRFKVGDKVATLFNQGHLAGSLDQISVATGLGGVIDGTLRQYGAFDEQGLVHIPSNLDWQEASTLSCAALTAWNGLYGLESRALKPGDLVLTQGTGGVSIFAVQVCHAFSLSVSLY